MSRARRRREAESGGNAHERWLVSYADFVTLLFGFFTMLYAISVVDAEKGYLLTHSIRESFGQRIIDLGDDLHSFWPADSRFLSADPEVADARRTEIARFRALEKRARDLGKAGAAGIRVRRSEEGLVISLAGSSFFASGTTGLGEDARVELRELAAALEGLPNHIRVEGHTDDTASTAAALPSNWHLSAQRAVEVVRELERAGIAAHRLSASGFADQRPLVSNGTPQGRRMNRRVDLVVLRTRMTEADR